MQEMTKKYKYSIRLNIAAIFCFFLPFFYTGCEEENKSANDSFTTKEHLSKDSIIKDSDSITQLDSLNTLTIDRNESNSMTESKSKVSDGEVNKDDVALRISKQFPMLATILVSKRDTYSGIAVIINTISLVAFYSIIISFFFLTLSLIAKYIEPNARKVILMLEMISLICLIISRPANYPCEILWGFWITIVFVSSLVIYDLYELKSIREK